jgi:hypothetical protein
MKNHITQNFSTHWLLDNKLLFIIKVLFLFGIVLNTTLISANTLEQCVKDESKCYGGLTRTTVGDPKFGDIYKNIIPISDKVKIYLPDGLWQVVVTTTYKGEPSWHAPWYVISLKNLDKDSPVKFVFYNYFKNSSSWQGWDTPCDKPRNFPGINVISNKKIGITYQCLFSFHWNNSPGIFNSLKTHPYWKNEIKGYENEFIYSLPRSGILFESIHYRVSSTYIREVFLLDDKSLNVDGSKFFDKIMGNNEKKLNDWFLSYSENRIKTFFDNSTHSPLLAQLPFRRSIESETEVKEAFSLIETKKNELPNEVKAQDLAIKERPLSEAEPALLALKETAIKDAAAKEAADKEVALKEAAAKEAAAKEAAAKEAAIKEAAAKEAAAKDAAIKEAAAKEAAAKDAAIKEAAAKEAAAKEAAIKDAAAKEAAAKVAAAKEAAIKEAAAKEAAAKEAAAKEAAAKEAAIKEAAIKEAAAKDAAIKEAVAKEAAIKEAAAKEAAIKEAAAKEAAIKEAAIKEAAAKEAAAKLAPAKILTSNIKKALIIGNDSYENVAKLKNARSDANAMGLALKTVGYKVQVKNDLNHKDMKKAIRQFKMDIQPGDEVFIFFAGHGLQIAGSNYLLPIDITAESEDQVKDDAIQLQRLLDDMNDQKARLTLALIDACRDNPFPKSGRALGGRGLAPTSAATGQMIIFSAGTGQQALDRLGSSDNDPNSVFTRIFINEIKKPGVRIDNVIREVRKKVVEAAKSVGHDQVPAIYDQVVGDFYFIE